MMVGLLAGVRELSALQLTASHSPASVLVGNKLTLTFTLHNDGATPASGTLFTNPLPPSTVFVSTTVSNAGFSLSNNVFNYAPATIQPGGQEIFSIVVTPVSIQWITNLACWVGADGELVQAGEIIPVISVLPGPRMKIGRASHTSTLLKDGRVLVAGGLAIDTYVTSFAETYSPVQNSFTLLNSTMTAARSDHTATLLTNGWVLLAGGRTGYNVFTTSLNLFNPTNNVFTAVASLGVARASHTATLLPNGDVVFAGGARTNTLIERFRSANGTVSTVGNLRVPRSGHVAALLPDGRILFAGGTDSSQAFAEVFDPDTGTSTNVAPAGHNVPAVAVTQGKVLAHGYTIQPDFGAELYDLQANSFIPLVPPSDIHFMGHYLTLNSGEVLITAGLYSVAVDIFNPRTAAFTPSYPLAGMRTSHSAVQLADGRVLITGGYDFDGIMSSDRTSTELYAIRLDMDQDGMDDDWELANDLDPARRADSVEDDDGDGHTNLQEYLAGTGPHDPASVLRIVSSQRLGDTLRIRFSSILGKSYRIERTTNVAGGGWAVVASEIAGTGQLIEYNDTLPSEAEGLLYRVRLLP